MHDLRVGPESKPEIAIECVGAVNPVRTEAWNIGPDKGPIFVPIAGDWRVVLRPTANIQRVRRELVGLLRAYEKAGLGGFTPVDSRLRQGNPTIFATLDSLEVASLSRVRSTGEGRVHLGMTGIRAPWTGTAGPSRGG